MGNLITHIVIVILHAVRFFVKVLFVVKRQKRFSDISTNLITYIVHVPTYMPSLDSYWLMRFCECMK